MAVADRSHQTESAVVASRVGNWEGVARRIPAIDGFSKNCGCHSSGREAT